MEKGVYVKDMVPASEVSGVYAVEQAVQAQSRNGPYWRLTLTDASGSVEAKIWHPLSAEYSEIPSGRLVWLQGRAGLFREQVQLTIERLQLLEPAEAAQVDPAAIMPASPYDLDAMLARLDALCQQEFTHTPWRKLVQSVLQNAELRAALRVAPAAKGVHHAYAGGLLEHTLSVFTLCRRIADQYPELDRQTLLAGALFHDIGKLRELSGGLSNDYTDVGRLMGHIMLGVELLGPYLAASGLSENLQAHLKHLILSHHGELAFGAVRQPQTAEALALHYADNLDAKMAQCRGLFQQLGEGADWTAYQNTLGRSLFRAAHTPGADGQPVVPPTGPDLLAENSTDLPAPGPAPAAGGAEAAAQSALESEPGAQGGAALASAQDLEPFSASAPAGMPEAVSAEEWASLEADAESLPPQDCPVEAVTAFEDMSEAACWAEVPQSFPLEPEAVPQPPAQEASVGQSFLNGMETAGAGQEPSAALSPMQPDEPSTEPSAVQSAGPSAQEQAGGTAGSEAPRKKRKKVMREECLSLLKV